ncbi:AAA family ATPase [Azospirillum agricola]|uniref:AAA family ATPase n=1 Tax=Azospirillum agricola TaxID=1720247 RepID=UPI000A0F3057|nr:AAA family ATPase [Azospirillum agricola]MBP2232789.1 cellulose biosynthesis protein BcsQ [Azospirillum agricola]SMH48165.1 Helix-turn-helix domain-containing protein [Azospirillum lipoferum]
MTGEELKALRERRGLTQTQMAAFVNELTGRKYDKQRLSKWETGKEAMPRDVLGRLLLLALERPATEAPRAGTIIAIGLQKGGTAKTATSINLAFLLARAGNRVLLVDADPQGNATVHVGVPQADVVALTEAGRVLYHALMGKAPLSAVIRPTGVAGLDVVPSSIALASADTELPGNLTNAQTALAELLDGVRADYDVIVIDCAPNLGAVTINALTAADYVLVPCQAEPHAILGVSAFLDTVAKIQRRLNPRLEILGILPTMVNPRQTQDKSSLEDINRLWGAERRVFPPVPRATIYAQAAGANVITLDADIGAPGVESYAAIATALLTATGRLRETVDAA